MTSVRLLVGARKSAFVLAADGSRTRWDVAGPHFGGWEVFHVAGSTADPGAVARGDERLRIVGAMPGG